MKNINVYMLTLCLLSTTISMQSMEDSDEEEDRIIVAFKPGIDEKQVSLMNELLEGSKGSKLKKPKYKLCRHTCVRIGEDGEEKGVFTMFWSVNDAGWEKFIKNVREKGKNIIDQIEISTRDEAKANEWTIYIY